MATVKVKCSYCGSDDIIRYRKNSTERQHHPCRNIECYHKTFQLEYKNNASRPGTKEKIIRIAMNGSGVQDTGQVLGTSKYTVTTVKNGKICKSSE